MWSLRTCLLACACASAAAAVIKLSYEQPLHIPNDIDNKEQYFTKSILFDEPIWDRYGELKEIIFVYKGKQNDDEILDDFAKSPEVHPVTVFIDETTKSPEIEPISVDEDEEPTWVPATKLTAPSLTLRAFVAGKEGWDGSPLWIIRANHSGEVIPGKLAIKHRASYIPFGGKEVPVENFEVLCAPQHSLKWERVGFEFGYLPDAAIAAGINDEGEPLYISRCRYKGSTTPGKYNPKRGTAYISFEGGEVFCWNYEILTVVKKITTSEPSWEEQAFTTSAPDYEYLD